MGDIISLKFYNSPSTLKYFTLISLLSNLFKKIFIII